MPTARHLLLVTLALLFACEDPDAPQSPYYDGAHLVVWANDGLEACNGTFPYMEAWLSAFRDRVGRSDSEVRHTFHWQSPEAFDASPCVDAVACAFPRTDVIYSSIVPEEHELVEACARLVQRWTPLPAPAWVTCLPSTRHPDLVPGFARRLAAALGLPFVVSLEKAQERPQQKTMTNSTQQARNVDGAFRVIGRPPAGPVLLVDDLVHSGWTMTMAAWLLREAGAGAVFPLALATTGVR